MTSIDQIVISIIDVSHEEKKKKKKTVMEQCDEMRGVRVRSERRDNIKSK